MPRRRLLWKRLGLVCCGGLVGLLLAEVALRLLGVSFPLPYVPDSACGSRLRPGLCAWYTKEGRAYFRINSAGFRDREHCLEKPPDTFRVAVLGDSYAEALQVDQQETFWAVLERELQQRDFAPGRAVEILNFGVSGFGTAQELEMLRQHAWAYAPDLILLAVCTGNDIRNNSRRLETEQVRPFYFLRDGAWQIDRTFLEHRSYLIAQSTKDKIKNALINRCRLLQVVKELRMRRQAANQAAPAGGLGLDDLIYREPPDDDWRDAWEVTERLIAAMHAEVGARQARFHVVTLSNPLQVHPDRAVREAYQRTLGVADLFYPERRLSELGRREGFPVTALAPRMQQYATEQQVYLHGFSNTKPGDGHWNADGHRLAGQWIAEALFGHCATVETESTFR